MKFWVSMGGQSSLNLHLTGTIPSGPGTDGFWFSSERPRVHRVKGVDVGWDPLLGFTVALTAGLQCTVIEKHLRVRGIAPRPMAVRVGVPAEVLLQLREGSRSRSEPRREGRQRTKPVYPEPPWSSGLHGRQDCPTHCGLCGVSADQCWQRIPLRVLLTEPRYCSPMP